MDFRKPFLVGPFNILSVIKVVTAYCFGILFWSLAIPCTKHVRVTLFRPCIDLHQGVVKQIVGGSLTEEGAVENHVSPHSAAWFAARYRDDGLMGGHVIQLGPGNQDAALQALGAYPKGLQVGGGVAPDNARMWLDAGAHKVIVTSYLFDGGELSQARLDQLAEVVAPSELVIDLSCRRVAGEYFVATERWQRITSTRIDETLLVRLAPYCSEFLVHAADVEGLCRGIEVDLVSLLGKVATRPCTYAGGAKEISDLRRVEVLSQGALDLTFGSSLDIFGGSGVAYTDCVEWNQKRERTPLR